MKIVDEKTVREKTESTPNSGTSLAADEVFAVPLSFGQERLWMLDRLEPNSSVYNVPLLLRLQGQLNVPVLQQALTEIVRRHDGLRATFGQQDEIPVQIIPPPGLLHIAISDLSATPLENRETQAKALARQEAATPFDLSRGPVFRVSLFRLSAEDHVLLLNVHHIVFDGWSTAILLRELSALYEAFLSGKPSPLPELRIRYVDYAVWQRQYLSGKVLEEKLSYWRKQLAGAPASLDLPTDRPRPHLQTFRGSSYGTVMPRTLLNDLRSLSQREGATLFMTLLAVFNVLMAKYSGQEDIVIGSPIAGRNRGDTEKLIGFFVNTLAIRTDLSGNPSFHQLLARVREATLGAFEHQDLPFEKLVEELHPQRDLSRNPIFQVMFALQNMPKEKRELPGLTIAPFRGAEVTTAKFDLLVATSETEDGLRVTFEYNTDLFDRATIERMAQHFRMLLEATVADAGRPVTELPLLTEVERQHVLAEFNRTETDYPHNLCLHQLFQSQADRTPAAPAVVFGEEQLSYDELNRRSNQLAHYLLRRGIGQEARVGIYLERSPAMLVALLGVLKAGAAYVPLDPAFPKERISFIADDAELGLLLTQGHLAEQLLTKAGEFVRIDADWPAIALESVEAPKVDVQPENLAYVLYTSGSTGKPKGVQIQHRSVVNFLNAMRAKPGLGADDVLLAVTTLSFDIAGLELYLPLTVGARVVLATREQAVDGAQLVRLLSNSGITVMQATPATWRVLLESGWTGNPKFKILCGGEALSRELADQLLPRCRELWNMYGPTETTIWSSVFRVRDTNWSIAPIGRPIANTQMYVLDKKCQPLPIGVAGELYIGGDGIARGYWKRPELTVEKFVTNLFRAQEGARLYATGDQARWLPDGNLQYLGRLDTQVKVRGYRIELGEVENALAKHPDVQQTVAMVREDVPGDKRLVAYVISKPDSNASSSEWRGYLRQSLPEYMIPSDFVSLEQFPLTPNGKVDRRALPAPDSTRVSTEFVAARNPGEELLCGIWSEVLRVPTVGVHDNFFELGGHSLLATQVISRIQRTLKLDVPLRAIFEESTVAGLAKRVEQLRGAGEAVGIPPLYPVPRAGGLPLSFSQQRLWFLEQLQPGTPAYNIAIALRLSGTLDVNALRKSLEEIVRRHEVLRTTFALSNDQPFQVIGTAISIDLPTLDLGSIPEEKREEEARVKAEEQTQLPFDLQHGPLIRASLLRLDTEDHILLLTMHHIVSDGWSMGIFSRDLATGYRAFSAGEPLTLPHLPIQYADFSAWQRSWLQGEALEKRVGYWISKLTGAPQLLELPTDRPRPSVESFRGATHSKMLPLEVLQHLRALTRREGVTLFMTLLAAFDVLLCRHSGQEDIVVGSPIANRNRSELEDLIGFFANTLVLRTDLSGNPNFRELLARVRETALDAYAHQDLPFEKLVEHLPVERSLSHNPVFQVMFALQNAPSEKMRLPGLNLSTFPVANVRSMFDLTLFMWESPNGLALRLQYNTDLFDAATIERMAERFQVLLEGIVADPGRPISELPLLTDSERKQLLEQWNDTDAKYPSEDCIHHLIEAQAKRTPEAIAVQFGDETLSYAELSARSTQLAHYLQSRGVGPEVLVGICLERSIDMVVGVLGIMKAGGAYVPLDPAYPEERIAFILEDAKASVLLTEKRFLNALPRTAAEILQLDEDWVTISKFPVDPPLNPATSDNLAYVIYTSGSTGKPKGVQIQHRSVINFLHSMSREPGLYQWDKLLAVTTLSFDIAGLELYLPLTIGARLIVASREETQDGRLLIRKIEKEAVTFMQATPATWRLMLESGWAGNKHLKILCGGEALPKELVDQLLPRCAELWNMYGPTETTIWSTIHRVTREEPGLASIGRPIANTETYVLDRWRHPVPIGVPGELYIGGDGLARGYLNRPELTDEKFVRHPFDGQNGKRLYRTGDVARFRSDGNLSFLGRIDNQVKLRGFRIELGEIETVLTQHDSVKQSAVLVREDEPGNQNLVAYLLLDQNDETALGLAAKNLASEQVRQWGTTWDETYKQTSPASERTFNITGWNSSYTGLPVPKEEMAEWVERTVERIKELDPKKLFEVGCGTGLLLFRLAPSCERYQAIDLSQTALNSIRAQLGHEGERFGNVSLNQSSADNLSAFPSRTFDTLVLNSVVQYFPNVDYLVRVLEQAVELMQDGGSIFIGDVRNLGLLESFHTAVQLHQADDQLNTKELLHRIRRKIEEERELVIDPTFFRALQQQLPRISDVQIHLKSGRFHNEVTQFRYDVVLRIGNGICQEADCTWLDWTNEGLTPEGLAQTLQQNRAELIGISSIPNARNWEAVSAWRKINDKDAPATASDLRRIVRQHGESLVEPDVVAQIAADCGYSATIEWSRDSSQPVFDAVFHKLGTPWAKPHAGRMLVKYAALNSYANNPLRQAIVRQLVPDLKLWLKKQLPEYMVPSAFVVLDAFPLTPNGKVDRRALPAPGAPRLEIEASYVAPRTDTEKALAAIWAEVLRIDNIGTNHDFFALGGHSLLATQVISRIQKHFNRELALQALFEHPTIAALAKQIDEMKTAMPPTDSPKIGRASRSAFRAKRSSF